METGVFKREPDLAVEKVEKVESKTKIMTSLNMVTLPQSGPATSASSSPLSDRTQLVQSAGRSEQQVFDWQNYCCLAACVHRTLQILSHGKQSVLIYILQACIDMLGLSLNHNVEAGYFDKTNRSHHE